MYTGALNTIFVLPAEGGGRRERRAANIVDEKVTCAWCTGLNGLERAEERWRRSGVCVVVALVTIFLGLLITRGMVDEGRHQRIPFFDACMVYCPLHLHPLSQRVAIRYNQVQVDP